MRRWLVAPALVAVAAALAIWLLGVVTPADHVAASEADFAAAPGDLWPLISDPNRFPEWRPDLGSVEILPAQADALRWVESGEFGTITYRLVESVPGQRFAGEIADSDQGYSGGWTYELTPNDGGTTVRITERGHIDNAMFRAISRLTGLNATMDGVLEALGEAVGEEVAPRHVPPSGDVP